MFGWFLSTIIAAYRSITSLCNCFGQPRKSYDILCNEDRFPRCSGNWISPIRLSLKKSVVFHEMPRIKFFGYDAIIPGEFLVLKNSGTSLSIFLDDRTPSSIDLHVTGGFLQGKYKFRDLHFHWKPTDRCKYGTEHSIGDKHTHLEMHIVHYNVKYEKYEEALQNRDGIVILAFLFKKSKTIQISPLYPVIRKMHRVMSEDQHTTFDKGFALESLIPIQKSKYFTYHGTTSVDKPGAEAVTWIIFQQILKMTQNDLKNFRNLRNNHNNPENQRNEDYIMGDRIVIYAD